MEIKKETKTKQKGQKDSSIQRAIGFVILGAVIGLIVKGNIFGIFYGAIGGYGFVLVCELYRQAVKDNEDKHHDIMDGH